MCCDDPVGWSTFEMTPILSCSLMPYKRVANKIFSGYWITPAFLTPNFDQQTQTLKGVLVFLGKNFQAVLVPTRDMYSPMPEFLLPHQQPDNSFDIICSDWRCDRSCGDFSEVGLHLAFSVQLKLPVEAAEGTKSLSALMFPCRGVPTVLSPVSFR